MPETVPTPNPAPTGDNPNPNPTPTGDNPSNQPGGSAGDQFDSSKLSDEQLAKVLEDQRLWKTQRLSELREKGKKYDEYEKTRQQKEQDDLKKKGEWETLATTNEERAKAAEQKYQNAVIDQAIMTEAAKLGVTDLEAAKLLINRGDIALDEHGAVSGVAEAVKALVTQRAYLVGGKPQDTSVGTGTNPPNPNAEYDFKMSQLSDAAFYQKNRDAILLAQSQGRILDDRAGAR